MSEADLAQQFLAYSREKLVRQYMPRLRHCVLQLSACQLWWRAHETSNSIGNLVLHLEGNIRQWILAGLGGEPDTRQRQTEFDQRSPIVASALLDKLEATVAQADRILAALTPKELLRDSTIQGHDVTGLEAVYHVVEHFSTHLGQIVYLTKMLLDVDLGFYEYLDQSAAGHKP